ncbi:MFS transporter [Angustibacter sp. McL0619]|uniref:MFS transporter n=1 Tax=Angustibacter sp. McL0619 TaxID=3415676 RepID=UPI003CF81AAB
MDVVDATRRTGQATRRAATASGRMGRTAWRRVRRVTTAQGAGESGLAKVIELHAVSAAGDALVLLALANTVFFSVPVGEARSRVALYLLVTMLPFVVIAPVLGPLLDRFRHGRRYALAVTFVTRAFLAWVMAGAVAGGKEAFALYPAAFGYLVANKAYLVTRAAAIPRVQPRGVNLVTANSRVLLGGIAAVAVATPVAVLVMRAGPEWVLRLAFVVYVVGTGLSLALPIRVDSAVGEVAARLSSDQQQPRSPSDETAQLPAGRRSVRWSIGPRVVLGLRAVATLRGFTGFLTFFLAFALRTDPISDSLPLLASIGLVVGAAGIGNTVGTSLGALLRRLRPELVVTAMLALAGVGAGVGALWYGMVPVLVTGLCAGLAAALGKLSLDALIQIEVPEDVRASAFARSETVLQLAWVVGGGIGICLPIPGAWGLAVAAVALLVSLAITVRSLVRSRRPSPRRPSRVPS